MYVYVCAMQQRLGSDLHATAEDGIALCRTSAGRKSIVGFQHHWIGDEALDAVDACT